MRVSFAIFLALLLGACPKGGVETDTDADADTDTDTDTDTDGDTDTALSDCIDDGDEPDDTLAEASLLALGTPHSGQVCTRDSDWFSFEAGAGCDIDVALKFSVATGDLDLSLYDGAENTLEYSWTEGDDEAIAYTHAAGEETLYIEVFGFRGAEAPYTLGVTETCTPCVEDANEPNDDVADATALVEGADALGQICAGDPDVYEVAVEPGCELDVTLTYSEAALDLTLVDDAGTELASSAATGSPATIAYTNNGSDTALYVEIAGAGSTDYVLRYDCLLPGECNDDSFEDNDDFANAAPLAADTLVDADICLDDADFFEIVTTGACLLDARIEFDNAEGDLDLYLYDATEVEIDESDSSSNDENVFQKNDAAGTWYLEVRPTWQAQAAYTLDYTCQDCTDADDTRTEATPLAEDVTTRDVICDGESDWYELDVPPACWVDGFLHFRHGDLELYLLDGPGTKLDSSESGDANEEVGFLNAGAATTMYLQVIGYGAATSSYELTYDCIPCADSDDDLASASPLAPATRDTDVICGTESDWYELTVGADCQVFASMSFGVDTGVPDLDLYLKDSAGTQLDLSQNTYGYEDVSYTANDTGSTTMYLEVLGVTGDGGYNLEYTVTCP